MGICAAVYSVVRSTACRCLQAPLSFVVKFPLKTEPKVETVMKALYWTLFEFYSILSNFCEQRQKCKIQPVCNAENLLQLEKTDN